MFAQLRKRYGSKGRAADGDPTAIAATAREMEPEMSTVTLNDTDRMLEKDIRDELAFDPRLDASDISVNVNRGVVTLSGVVKFYPEKSAAEKAVKRVKGVRGLAEELKVEPLGTHVRTDTDLAKTALTLLGLDVTVPKDRVTITVDRGWLRLEGTVDWDYQKRNAERAVRAMPGVIDLVNDIVVRQTIVSDDVSTKIRKSFERSADIDAGRITVEIDRGRVTLRGTVRSWTEHDEATRAAYSLSGVTQVQNFTTVW